MKRDNKKAFTLVEIMVVIAIISLIMVGFKSLNFNRISNQQKLDTKINQINSQIEEIRNNSLLGRGIGTDLSVPTKYKIDFSTSGSGIIKTQFLSGTYQDYNLFNNKIDFSDKFESISKISCLKLDGTETANIFTNSSIGTGTIIIEGANMTLSGGCDPKEKILKVEIKRNYLTGSIEVNTLNGLIEIAD